MADSIANICNRALSSLGAQTTIADLNEISPAAATLRLWYDNTRQDLLRAAPWGFTRRQVALTFLGDLVDSASPYPMLYKYAYPADCLNVRYVLPPMYPVDQPVSPQVAVGLQGPYSWAPSRQCRFIINYNDGALDPVKTITSNVLGAICVYTADVQNPDVFDPSFSSALSAAVAAQSALAITGNIQLARLMAQVADLAVNKARASDANEAIPTNDHQVDWIEARGAGGYSPWGYAGPGNSWGQWFNGFTDMNWAM